MENNTALLVKILKVQQAVSGVKKDSVNPHFKNSYFDINSLLEVLKPALHAEGLLVMQPLTTLDGKQALKTMIIDSLTGEVFGDTVTLPECNKPQDFGSSITYFRRYALQAMFALEAEDDDGEKGMGRAPSKKKAVAKKPTGLKSTTGF